jgi:hypothetical protein
VFKKPKTMNSVHKEKLVCNNMSLGTFRLRVYSFRKALNKWVASVFCCSSLNIRIPIFNFKSRSKYAKLFHSSSLEEWFTVCHQILLLSSGRDSYVAMFYDVTLHPRI